MEFVAMVVSWLAVMSVAERISEQCEIEAGTRVICRCVGDEEFLLPEGHNYENATSLRVSSCATANLHFSSMVEATRIEEIIVQNISERLTFELFLRAKKIRTLKLTDIRLIPLIASYAFKRIREIDVFHIANTRIGSFEGQFSDSLIGELDFVNVTIGLVDRMTFSGSSRRLKIVDSVFENVTDTLVFSFFSEVTVRGSKFALNKPGLLLIEGDVLRVESSVFSNASTNLVATRRILLNGSCADGKSSLRISSDMVRSENNRLPTEIVYTGGQKTSGYHDFLNRNNTVCIAGNCRCPKSSSQDHPRVSHRRILLHACLIVILWASI